MTSEGCNSGQETIVHLSGIILLLRRVSIPHETGNFNITWVVDGIAWIFLILGLPMIPLNGDGDLTMTKFIQADVEYSASPIFTGSSICPIGHMISSLKPMRDVFMHTFNELGFGDPVHESGDSQAFWISFNVPTLIFEPLHKISCGLSFSLLDVKLMQGMKGSVSSHTHGWDKSSSSILDFCFFDLDFQCPPSLSSLFENVFAPRKDVPSCLLNTPPSLLSFPSGLCLLSRLIREKTLACSWLSNMLRERPDLRPLRYSPLTFGVLDSECCDISQTFEFLPEHPSKLRRAFTSFSFSCWLRQMRARSGSLRFVQSLSPLCFTRRTWGGVGIRFAGSLMWPEWYPFRAKVYGYRDCGRELPSVDISWSADGLRPSYCIRSVATVALGI
nr:hypothetical protein [Tanacetum cinerariifolium]